MNAISSNIDGFKHEKLKHVELLLRSYSKTTSGSPAWFIALYYAHLENKEECFNWLQKSFERHEVEMVWLRSEPLLKFIQCDPRYLDLYNKVGFLTEPPCILKDGTYKEIELNQ